MLEHVEKQLAEHEVIAHVASFLLKGKKYEIEKIAVKKSHRNCVKNRIRVDLVKSGENNEEEANRIVEKVDFEDTNGPDILCCYRGRNTRPQRKLTIEAKGGNTKYSFYALLGQLICKVESESK